MKLRHRLLRFFSILLILYVCAILSGCAGWQSFREGKQFIEAGLYDEGFKKVDQAIAADPRNAEYRIYAVNRRLALVNGLLARADAARGLGRAADAEALFKQVLDIEAKNQMAQSGIKGLATDQRHQRLVAQAEAQFKDGKTREAEEIVRAVVAENPNQRDANYLRQRLNEKRATEPRIDPRLAEAFRKPVSLDFRDAQLKSVFDVLARASGLNFVFDKDIKSDTKVTIVAKQTTVEEALKLLAVTQQIEQRTLNENSILIYPNTPAKAKDYQPLVVRSFYLAHADVKQVASTLRTILKARDVVVNEKLNLLILRDSVESVRLAEKLIALEDIGEAEVMLEVEVLELKRARLTELGIRWPDQLQVSVSRTAGSALTLFDILNFNSSRRNEFFGTIDVAAKASSNILVNGAQSDGDTNILANPRIRVRNREKAKIHIGDRVPVITTTSTATGFVSESVTYVDVGLKLDVEPTIFLDDEVAIKLSLEVSSIAREIQTRSGSLSYQIGTRTASTVLKLRDGETQVLAGLISDEDRSSGNRIPGLGQFPVVGRLFGSQRDDISKTEIVLAITPRLLRAVRRADLVSAEFDSGTETSIGSRVSATNSNSPQSAAPSATTVPPSPPIPIRPNVGSPPPQTLPPRAVSGSVTSSNFQGDGATGPPISAPSATSVAAATEPTTTPPNASAAAKAPGATSGKFSASWQGSAAAQVGDSIAFTLAADSPGTLTAVPLLVGFDPAVLELQNVVEGDFMRRGGATSFRSQIDAGSGRVFVEISRDSGVTSSGSGGLLTLSFRALKAGGTVLRLLAITPNPAPSGGVISLPVEQRIEIN